MGQGRLAQWKTVCFVKFCLVRLWFESRHTFKSFSCANLHYMHDPESSKYVGGTRNLAISDTEQLLTPNL